MAPSWTPVYQTDRDIHWLIISGAKFKPCLYEQLSDRFDLHVFFYYSFTQVCFEISSLIILIVIDSLVVTRILWRGSLNIHAYLIRIEQYLFETDVKDRIE